MKVAILYDVLSRDGTSWRVGGIQTYVHHLQDLCLEAGWQPMIFQPASCDFQRAVGRMHVRGVRTLQAPNDSRAWSRSVLDSVLDWAGGEQFVVIFGQMHMSVPVPRAQTIGIQHGVSWDIDLGRPESPWITTESRSQPMSARRVIAGLLRPTVVGRIRTKIREYDRLLANTVGYEDVDVRVCVDHNFPNWYRTLAMQRSDKPEYVILNPAQTATRQQLASRQTEDGVIRVLFARRFYWYRGTAIMAEAGRRLLADNENVMITFAGEGPDREPLTEYFREEPRVKFICYSPEESLQVHLAHHVAVNASLGSEGSSLSVAEAMGAGCAVVSTDIGGITNMIIDGHNGLLVNTSAEALYRGLSRLVTQPGLRANLGHQGWRTACDAFSIDRWRNQWSEVILDAARGFEHPGHGTQRQAGSA